MEFLIVILISNNTVIIQSFFWLINKPYKSNIISIAP